MDFEAITQLQLRRAYSDNQRMQVVKSNDDLLVELFECERHRNLFVYDDLSKGHAVYVADTAGLGRDKVFVIKNAKHKNVFLWHIDGVFYRKESKCDCAVLTKGDVKFIEFKSNAKNETPKAIRANYEEASQQLLRTLKDVGSRCQSVGIVLLKVVKIEAYAVFNRTVPRNNALQKQIAANFLFKSKGVKLKFENESEV